MTDETQRANRLQAILGDELVELLDRRARLEAELLAVEADIYAVLVNRMQSSGGTAMLRPYELLEARVRVLEGKTREVGGG